MEHEHTIRSEAISPYPLEYHPYPGSLMLDIQHYARLLTPYASPALGAFIADMEHALNRRKGQDTILFGSGPRHAWDIRYETEHRRPATEDIRSDVLPLYMQTRFFQQSEFGVDHQADTVRRMITTGSADYDTKSRLFDPRTSFGNAARAMRTWFETVNTVTPSEIRYTDPVDPSLFEYGLNGYNKTHGYPLQEGRRVAVLRTLPIPNNPDMDIVIISLGIEQKGHMMPTYQIHATGMNPHDLRHNNPDNFNWQEYVQAHVRHHFTDLQIIPVEGAGSAASSPLAFPESDPTRDERLVSQLQSVFRGTRAYILRDTGLHPRSSREYIYPGKPPLTFVRLELPDSLYERMNGVIGLLSRCDLSVIDNIQTDIIAELATIALWNPIALGELLSHTELPSVLNGLHDVTGTAHGTLLDGATWKILSRSRLPRYSSMTVPAHTSPEPYQKELAAGVYQHTLLEPLMEGQPPDWSDFTDGIQYWVTAIDAFRAQHGASIPATSSDPVVKFTEYFRFAFR